MRLVGRWLDHAMHDSVVTRIWRFERGPLDRCIEKHWESYVHMSINVSVSWHYGRAATVKSNLEGIHM